VSEILERIEDGDKVIYDNVTIVGDLDMSDLDLPFIRSVLPGDEDRVIKIIAAQIQIRNCWVSGLVNFDNVLFKENVDFSGTKFICEARFKESVFGGCTSFDAASFCGYVTFKNSWFEKEVSFRGAEFCGIANFGNTLFSAETYFGSTKFSDLCTNFSGVRFEGDIDFTHAHFSGTANFDGASFGGTASFWQANFLADSNFKGASFKGYSSFLKCSFIGNADFRFSNFHQDATFEITDFSGSSVFLNSHFHGNINFYNSNFNGNVSFENAKLSGRAEFIASKFDHGNFKGSRFLGDAHFEKSRFTKEALFSRSSFLGKISGFSESQFDEYACFNHVIFSGSAQFNDSKFLGDAIFDGTRFGGDAIFNKTHFQGKAVFRAVSFNEDARFLGAKFVDASDFAGSEFYKNLVLENTRIYTLSLINVVFAPGSHISLQDSDFVRLDVRWHLISDRLIYDGATYLALIRNFRNMEWFEDADDCYYHYRKMSQKEKQLITWNNGLPSIHWSKLLDLLAWISCGYGVRPKYTIFLSILLIILFAGLFWVGDSIVVEHINSTAFGPHLAKDDPIHSLSFADHLYFSAMIFTAKTQVKWYPTGFFRYLATVESILGWLLMALFLVTLGRTMIR
jgi:hypothetical protein